MNVPVVVIVGLFFIIGITVGVIAVVAMAAVRSDRSGRLSGPPESGPDGPGRQPPGPGLEDLELDDRPRWPGDADYGYYGR